MDSDQNYRERADFYDLEFPDCSDFPLLDFVTSQYLNLHSKVLEIPCGSGRTLPFWKGKGFKVTFADICLDMVEKIQRKLLNERDLNAVEGDMRFPERVGKFNLVLFLREAWMLLCPEDRGQSIAGIAKALETNGICLVDLANLSSENVSEPELLPPYIAQADGMKTHDFIRENSEFRLERWHTSMQNEKGLEVKFDYNFSKGNFKKSLESSMTLYKIDDTEFVDLAKTHGLEVVDKFGWYDRRDWNPNSPRCILILRKK